ncbi:putative porin [Myxococcota bacterium]|nr:putative porin [Myxococcota bacterium]
MKTFSITILAVLITWSGALLAQEPEGTPPPAASDVPVKIEPNAEEKTPPAVEEKMEPKEGEKPVTPVEEKKEAVKDIPLKFKGNLRYRHETIDLTDEEANHRHRIRLRFGVFSEINQQLEFGFQMASGTGDPISTNQTLSPAFTKKPLTIDLAYFNYKPVEGLSIVGGKMKNPMFRPGDSQLMWDSDLTPEGLSLSFARKISSMKVFATGVAFWNADRKGDEDDAHILGGQGGLEMKFGAFQIVVAGALYNYTKILGYGPVYDDNAFGNTLDANTLYANDYNLLDAGLELRGKLAGLPFSVFGQFVQNLAADEEKTAFLAGFSIGEAKIPMGWRLQYNFRSLQRDAVFATFSDSDFIGGGTGGSGHMVSAEFAISSNMLLGLTVQRSTLDDDAETDYTRVQVDLGVKF